MLYSYCWWFTITFVFMLFGYTTSPSTRRLTVPQLVRRSFFVVCYTGTRVKGLSCQYSRTKPPFGLISIRVTFLWGKARRPGLILAVRSARAPPDMIGDIPKLLDHASRPTGMVVCC